MKLLSRQSRALPGVTGVARVSRRSDALLGRVGHKDIVVIDHVDIDRATADALVKAGVTAVVNASPSISGRYPNLGPEILVASDVILIDGVGEKIFSKLKDGAKIRVDGNSVYAGEDVIAQGTEQTPESVADLLIEAKTGMSAQLEAFAANAIEYMKRERTLLLDGVGIPEISTDLADRQVLLVAQSADTKAQLKSLKQVHLGLPPGAGRRRRRRRCAARRRVQARVDHRQSRVDRFGDAALRRRGDHSRAHRRPRARSGTAAGPRRRCRHLPGERQHRRPGAAAGRRPGRLDDRHGRDAHHPDRPARPRAWFDGVDLPGPDAGGEQGGRRARRWPRCTGPGSPGGWSRC